MDIFVDEVETKNNVKILICGICSTLKSEICIMDYKTGVSKLELSDTTDEYFIDYALMQIIVKCSNKWVKAVGASVFKNGVALRSGGIIGDPFCDAKSAEEDIDMLSENLFSIAFAGRFGVVFEGTMEMAKSLKNRFVEILDMENKKIVDEAVKIMKESVNLFILVSDGSGDGGYAFVCGKNKSEYKYKIL